MNLEFYLDGHPFSAQVWQHVPREGDLVLLTVAGAGPSTQTWVRVDRVCWFGPSNVRLICSLSKETG